MDRHEPLFMAVGNMSRGEAHETIFGLQVLKNVIQARLRLNFLDQNEIIMIEWNLGFR